MPLVLYLKNHCYIQVHLDILLLILYEFLNFCFIKSIIHYVNICEESRVCVYIPCFVCICNTFPELFVEETIFSLLYCLYFVKFPLTMSESHSFMSDSLQSHGRYTPRSSVHGDTQGKDTRGDCRTLFHRIFLTQGSNPGLLNCRKTFYQLSHQGSPLTFIDYKWAYFWVLYFVPMICLLFFANTALY